MSITERNKQGRYMTIVSLQDVATFRWNSQLAEKLRALRGSVSRRELSERTRSLPTPVSEQYIQQLESPHLFIGKAKKPKSLTVSREIVESLCEALDIGIEGLFWAAKIPYPDPLTLITERSNIEL